MTHTETLLIKAYRARRRYMGASSRGDKDWAQAQADMQRKMLELWRHAEALAAKASVSP